MGFLDISKRAVKALQYLPGCTIERGNKKVITYPAAHAIFGLMCRAKGYSIAVNGLENLDEPGWVWSRHTSEKDIPDISYVLRSKTGKMPKFVARSSLVSTVFEREQYLEWGAMFLDRKTSQSTVQINQMRAVINEAAAGSYVVIFPEGTRNPEHIGNFNPGAAWMARMLASKHRNAPIYCMGVHRNGRKEVVLNIAPPFYMSDFKGMPRKKCLEKATKGAQRLVASLSLPDNKPISRGRVLEAILKGTRLASAGVSVPSAVHYDSECY